MGNSQQSEGSIEDQNNALRAQVDNLEQRIRAQGKTLAADPASAAVPLCHGETVDWMNAILAKMWPRVNSAVQKIVNEQVVPLVNAKLAKISRFAGSVEFNRFTIGEKAPVFGPIRIYELDDGLKLHLHIEYDSDVDISLQWGPVVRVGVCALRFQGDVVVKLSPLIEEVPVVGGLNVFFYNCPDIEMDFTGAANVADCPGINRILWSTVTGILSDMMVLPNVLGIPLGSEKQVDLAVVMCPEPVGMLRVKAKSAAGLTGADWHLFGKATSDPLVQVHVADTIWQSSTVKGTCDPMWAEDDSCEFMVFDREQRVRAMVLDHDVMGSDDALGYTEVVMISDACKKSDVPLKLFPKMLEFGAQPAADVSQERGSLTLQFDWLAIEPPESTKDTEQAVAFVKMTHVSVPWSISEKVVSVCLRATINDIVKTTALGASPKKKDDSPEDQERMECLRGTIRRLSAGNVEKTLIASSLKVKEELVDAVLEGKPLSEAEMPTPEVKRFVVNGALYFVMDRKLIKEGSALRLEIVDNDGNVLAEISTTVEKAAALIRAPDSLTMPGKDGEELKAKVSVSVRGLALS